MRCQMRPLYTAASVHALFSVCVAAQGQIAFIEREFYNMSDFVAVNRTTAVVDAHGGLQFHALSLIAWNETYAPNETSLIPAPDAGVLAFMHGMRSRSPALLRLWGGIQLCPDRMASCSMSPAQCNLTGQQLAAVARKSGLDGIQIYSSPFCKNAWTCPRTSGDYATGIASIIRSFREAAPTLEISLLANLEWDHAEIIVTGDPSVIFSAQTAFYFTHFRPCLEQAGPRCGAVEDVTYSQQGDQNFTSILEEMTSSNVSWLGQIRGATASEAENPPDFWDALSGFAAGVYRSNTTTQAKAYVTRQTIF